MQTYDEMYQKFNITDDLKQKLSTTNNPYSITVSLATTTSVKTIIIEDNKVITKDELENGKLV
ncbi:hypothetical protein [Tolumonas auensis]|uniref:hypothetical protein n=1 Tax=Tolumonas auensis TaxID=43948 RepID=UPI002AA687DD|nr:hypothetical protein [Tolumonas auensis]